VVGGTRPEHVSAFATPGLHAAACKRSAWRHRLNVGSAFHFQTRAVRAGLVWRSSRVVSLCQLRRRASLTYRSCRLSPAGASTWSALSRPRVLTPRVSSTGGAFTNECPASDVSRHRAGTTGETSGSRYQLARSEEPFTFVNDRSRTGIDPHGQNRACAERFKNDTAHDSKRLRRT